MSRARAPMRQMAGLSPPRSSESISVADIQHMGAAQLRPLIRAIGLGSTWGVFEFPAASMPGGIYQKKAKRFFDFRTLVGEKGIALTAIARFVVLRWLVPIGKNTRPISASTLAEQLNNLRRVASAAAQKGMVEGGGFWNRLSSDELYAIVPLTSKCDFGRAFRHFKDHKLLDDVIDTPTRQRSDKKEILRKGASPLTPTVSIKSKPFLALPDRFVAEMGWRCIWFIKLLGPRLLEGIRRVYDTFEDTDFPSLEGTQENLRRHAARKLAAFDWSVGNSGEFAPPFALQLMTARNCGPGEGRRQFEWPAATLPEMWQLAYLLQLCHLFVVALSGGPRAGELHSLTRSCLVQDSENWKLHGRTYKLEFREDGRIRDWPAPALCVTAVKQQVHLALLAQRAATVYGVCNDNDSLFVRICHASGLTEFGKPFLDCTWGLNSLVKAFGLESLLGDGSLRQRRLHIHRFRKTTGRLCGLAITNGLKVLTDLFGHQDPEQTLAYLLSNPDISEEARAVAKAQTIMFAQEAIETASEAGGPASVKVQQAKEDFARLRGVDKLDASSIEELAKDLTENGQYWELVRPGVLCTKLPGQVGACNGKEGAPDSSHCKTNCAHRFERAREKQTVDATIARLVVQLEAIDEEEEPMFAAHLSGQIAANLGRFNDVRAKWLEHPRVMSLSLGKD